MPNSQCKDFELAPLTPYSRDIFLPTGNKELDDFRAFILTLSVVFNELKDSFWLLQQLENGKPEATRGKLTITPYNGQWSGMRWIIQKNLISFLHEFSEMLLKNISTLDSVVSQTIISKMPLHALQSWEKLISSTSPKGKKGSFNRFIHRVRNNVGFHFESTKNYMNGYKSFLNQEDYKHIKKMYSSLGDCQEKTRFYFGDAAISGYLIARYKEDGITEKQVFDYSRDINNALRFYIEESMKYLEETYTQ